MASEMAASAATAVAPDRLDQPRHGKRGAPQAFARKLAEILRDEAESVISWNDAGTAFMVKDVERFSQDVLVKHYRCVLVCACVFPKESPFPSARGCVSPAWATGQPSASPG